MKLLGIRFCSVSPEARGNGLEPQGPVDLHGERIYFVADPSGLQISFQSRQIEGVTR